jgi:transposase-like protein
MEYRDAFKAAMVRRMTGPGATSARELARETGVHATTLSHWKRQAGKLADMSKKDSEDRGGRPDERTADEKLQLVLEASLLTDEELGEFLRRNGLHEADLERWREDALAGLSDRRQERRHEGDSKRIRELEREIRRKDKALAEAAALLVLQKKVQAIWGGGDDDTEAGSDK